MRRNDTDQKTYFRSSERVFRMNETWYFCAREGDQGPYGSEGRAKQECARYIEEKTELSHFQAQREEEARAHQKQSAAVTQQTKLEILPLVFDRVDTDTEERTIAQLS